MLENKALHIWLYAWHMQVFFSVSGILLSNSRYVNNPF